jgi:hypothetical protein
MANKTFFNKKFSDYLGENRAILDIIGRYESLFPPSPSPTPSITASPSVTPSNTATPTQTQTGTPSNTPSGTPTQTPTNTPSNTPTNTPSNTASQTPSNTPSNTQTGTPTQTPTNTATPTSTPIPTNSETPTNTPTETPTQTPTETPTNTPTNTATQTPTNTETPTNTPTPTNTETPTNTPTPTNTETPTNTPTPTNTETPTNTPTPTNTETPTNTPTPTNTETPTNTPTNTTTQTPTPTNTPAPITPSDATAIYNIFAQSNQSISGLTWSVNWNGVDYPGYDTNLAFQVDCCVEIPTVQTGDIYTAIINYAAGWQEAAPLLNFDKEVYVVGEFEGIVSGFYQWKVSRSRYLGSTEIDSDDNRFWRWDTTPATIFGCEQDIIAEGGFDFGVQPVLPTPTPTSTNTPTPTTTTTPTPTPTASGIPSGTTEANAYLEAVVQNGGTGITDSVSASTVTLFTSIVSNGLWNKIYAMYPYIGGVAASHALDARNGYNLTFNGGVTHNEYGVQGNGTNGYADTGFDIGSAYPGLAHSAGVYINLQGTVSNRIYDLGLNNPGTGVDLNDMFNLTAKRTSGFGNNTLFDQGTYPNGRAETTSESSASGMTIGSAESSSLRKLYRDGTNIATQTATQSLDVYAGNSIYLYAEHTANNAEYFSDNRQGFCFIGSGMTSSEVSTLSDIINDYQTSLGRNVY